jgi:ABC-type dipeptide/oligopeptide/nickel transport system permease component
VEAIRMSWTGFLARRFGAMTVTVWFAVTVNFFLFRALPGDYVSTFARVPGATKEFQDSLRAQFGLDRSMGYQYLAYLKNLLQGDLGVSFVDQQPVTDKLGGYIANTLPMVGLATVLAIAIGSVLGLIAAWRRSRLSDNGVVLTSLVLYSLPVQWLGMMLIFAFSGRLPTYGTHDEYLTDSSFWPRTLDYLEHMILPATTLMLVTLGGFVLVVRTAALENFGEDYVLTARAKGLSKWSVLWRHVFPNAMLPTITVIALSLGTVAGGAVLVETVFSWQGVGLATYEAVTNRDYPLLQGAFLFITVAVIFFNFVADVLYFKLDPRIRR